MSPLRLTCVMVFVALILTCSLASQAQWSDPINISNSDNFSYYASICFDSNGYGHMAWIDWDEAPVKMYYANNRSGSWQKVKLWESHDKLGNPCLICTPDDVLHLFYKQNDSSGQEHVWQKTKSASGSTWSSRTQLTPTEGGLFSWAAMNSQGDIYLIWLKIRFDPNRGELYGRLKPYQGSWGSIETIRSSSQNWPAYPYIAADGNDKWVVSYDLFGSKCKVRDSGTWGNEQTVASDGGGVKVTAAPNGEYAAAYYYDYNMYLKTSSNGGSTWSSAMLLSTSWDDTYLDRYPSMAYDSANDLHVLWQKIRNEGSSSRAYYRSRVSGTWGAETDMVDITSRVRGGGIFVDSIVTQDRDIHIIWNGKYDWAEWGDLCYIWKPYSGFVPGCGHISGTVKDQWNNNISGAAVEVQGTSNPVVYSASDGSYTIYNVPAGTYTVTASKLHYTSGQTTGVSVTSGQYTSSVNISMTQDTTPPAALPRMSATGSNGKVLLRWVNPSDGDFDGVMIRYSTSGYPASPTSGTLAANVDDGIQYEHTGLQNGVTYYYSAFAYDVMQNYASAKQKSCSPQAAPYSNLLSNGDMSTFSSGIASNWTGYRVNDSSSLISFEANTSYYMTDPSQMLNSIDSASLPTVGYTSAGLYQVVDDTTAGKVYYLTGYQDIYTADYGADDKRYVHNFGIDPTGGTNPGTPSASGTVGAAAWLSPDTSFWNKSKGGAPYYHGYHRCVASWAAAGDEISVWSGVTIDNDEGKDNADCNFHTDAMYLIEFDNAANSSGTLTNGGFETAVDLQNGVDYSDIVPTGWIPVGGGIGEIDLYSSDAWVARTGDGGVQVFNRRGCHSKGLMQKLATTAGTPISFTCWARGDSDTSASIGIDPAGGNDINSDNIQWVSTTNSSWTQLTNTINAEGGYATLFLRGKSLDPNQYDGYHAALFDDASATWTPGTPQSGTVMGTVRDSFGNGIVGATISTNIGGYSTTSGTGGAFTLANVQPGTYNVTASRSAYYSQTVNGISVVAGQTTSCNFNLVPLPGSIAGTVLDTLGEPVVGATVSTTSGGYSTTTASDGSYVLTSVESGTYTVQVTKTDYDSDSQSGVYVGPAQQAICNLTMVPPPGTIAGTVRSHCGVAMSGVTVSTDTGNYSTTTASDGSYVLSNVDPGTYEVSAYKNYSTSVVSDVNVASYQTTSVDITLNDYTWYSRETNGDFEDGFYGFWSGNSVGNGYGVLFTNDADEASWGQYTYSGTNDAQKIKTEENNTKVGIAQSVTGLLPGSAYRFGCYTYSEASDYEVYMAVDELNTGQIPSSGTQFSTATGQWNYQEISGVLTYGNSVTIIVWAERDTDGTGSVYIDNLTFYEGIPMECTNGHLQGYVKDSFTTPIAGATVQTSTGGYSATTASDGSYSITNIAPGTYSVTASKDGYSPDTETGIVINGDQTTTLDFALTAALGSISGTVKDICNQDLGGATVVTSPGGYSTTSASDGTYLLMDVPAGTYTVTASKSDYLSDANTGIVVTAGSNTTSNFSLEFLTEEEKLANGSFDEGFIDFWGGTIGDDWGAAFTNSASGASWDDHWASTSLGWVQKIRTTSTSTDVGLAQRVTGLTAGSTYTFSAVAYQEMAGYVTYMAVDETNSLADGVLPSSGTAFDTTSGQWNYQEVTGTVGSNGAVAVYIWTEKNWGDSGSVYVNNASLMVGTGGSTCPGHISGYVKDTSNNPIQGASVSTDTGGYSTVTASDGSYTLSNVDSGTYDVTASADGYQSDTDEDVSVSVGQTSTVNFNLSVSNTAPAIDSVQISAPTLLANDTTEYTVTLQASDDNGVSDIEDMRVLFDINTTTYASSSGRGYLVWGATQSDVTTYGGNWDIEVATGGGYWGFMNDDWGYQYITPVDCQTSTVGNQRTVTFTFKVKQAWYAAGPTTGNFIGMFVRDSATNTGWQTSDDVFSTTFAISAGAGMVEKLVNGDFEDGFFTFWGGDMADDWGAAFTNNANDAVWDDHYIDSTHGYAQRIYTPNTSTNAGIPQRVTGLTPGETYVFSAYVYQEEAGYQAYMAVDESNSLPDDQLPASGTAFATTADQWNYQEVTGTVQSNGEVCVYVWVDKVTGTNGNCYVDDCSLMVGTPTPPGSITGYVYDSSSNAISGATVTTDNGDYSTTSGSDGSYTISSVPIGTYSVTASASGYAAQTVGGVLVETGESTSVNFSLADQLLTEQITNGDFTGGFFSFWGGDMANNWGAAFTNNASGASWDDHNAGGDFGMCQRIRTTNTSTQLGIPQVISGLVPGSTYEFSAYTYQEQSGYVCYLAVDPNNSLASGVLPASGTAFATTTGQWNYQEVTGTVGSGGTICVYVWAQKVSGSDGNCYVDSCSLLGQSQ